VAAGGNGVDGFQIARLAAVVDGHDGSGFRRDGLFNGFRGDVEVLAHIYQHGTGAQVDNSVGRGAEGESRDDDLVSRADAQRSQGDVQAGSAGVYGDGVL
jgi:hypothetical protein